MRLQKNAGTSLMFSNQSTMMVFVLTVLTMVLMIVSAEAASSAYVLSVNAAVFYAASVTTIGAFFLINVALKNWVGVYYATLFALMLALVWALEGGMFAIWGSLSDDRNRSISMLIGLLGASVGFYTAERAIDPARALVMTRKGLRILAFFSLGMLFLAWFWPIDPIAMTVNLLLVMMFASHFLSTLTWRTLHGKQNRLPALISLGLLGAVLGIATIYGISDNRENLIGNYIFRFVFALVSIPTMATIIFSLIEMRKSRDSALEVALDAARKDAKMSAALLEMEHNYAEAREIAAQQTRQLSAASHDIRQPIASMRAELDALKGELAVANVDRLDRILDHFDTLTESFAHGSNSAAGVDGIGASEHVPAKLLFATLDRMFAAEAKARNIELCFVDSTKNFLVPAIVLMRIGGNFVANAIAHSHATKIVVGIRPSGNYLKLVVIDNGVGLTEISGKEIFAAGVKGATSSGEGIGLSIVQELADAHDLKVNSAAVKTGGAMFSVLIPRSIQS